MERLPDGRLRPEKHLYSRIAMDDLPNLQDLKMEESIFDSLQKNALETIRELSGQLWTDHAPHDPGITTLDILNYA